jgi:hypothetical protein
VPRREPVPGRDREHQPLPLQRQPVMRAGRPRRDQRQLGQARGEVPQHLVPRLLAQDDPDPRRVGPEVVQDARHQRGGDRVQEGQSDGAGARVEQFGQVGAELIVPAGDVPRRRQDHLAAGVGAHALSVPFEQTGAELALGPCEQP